MMKIPLLFEGHKKLFQIDVPNICGFKGHSFCLTKMTIIIIRQFFFYSELNYCDFFFPLSYVNFDDKVRALHNKGQHT